MDKLLSILSQADLADYQIINKETISHQCFFIKHALDQHRISSTNTVRLTIYVDSEDKTKRGSATKEIFPSETEEDIRKDIEDMKYNASLSMNPYYPLVANQVDKEEKQDYDLLTALKNVILAIESIKETESEKINSYEVFVNQYYTRIVNSQGVDVSYNSSDEMVEIVINSTSDNHEVEIYKMVEAGSDRTVESIVEEIQPVFKKAADRNKAVKVKTMDDMHVLISGSDLREFFNYFTDKVDTGSVYNRRSQSKVGDVIQQGDDCDKITLNVKAQLPYSSKNRKYSNEAVKAKDFTVVDKGQFVNYVGSQIYAHYLGLKDVGFVSNFTVEPGSKSVEEMKSSPYLEIVEFSSFQVDAMTGDFGGEFRLAYYYDGNTVQQVTSGSITANMNNVLDHIHLSKERIQIDNCVVPETIELFGINVAGN